MLLRIAFWTLITVTPFAAPALGQDATVRVNNPASISLGGEGEFVGPPAPSGEEFASDLPDEAASYTPPAREQAPLGQPNGPLAARPAVSSGEEGHGAGWIASLDPRNNDITRVVFALGIVIGLLLLLRVVARRMVRLDGAARPSGVMEILARYPVARHHQLLLIKVSRRVVLAHMSGTSMTPLTEFEQPDEVAQLLARLEAGARGRQAEHFRDVLRSFENDHGESAKDEWASHLESIKPQAIVDLTRGGSGPLRGVFGRRRSA